jgi:hypothetical protein
MTGAGSVVQVPPAEWSLPATINIAQSGTIGLRQYAANDDGWTISVTGLPSGVTYNPTLERIEAAAGAVVGSATATFTLSRAGLADVVDTATVAVYAGVAQTTFQYQDLEIYVPRPGLDTTNRCYKAYPGLEYNIRMAVAGGHYPYTYSLDTAPAGMTINANTGEIVWDSPVESGSPHTVTARVTDYIGQTQTVTWTITVTTTGFFFVDAVNGTTVAGGGTGTFANPWKTMADVYGADKNVTRNPGGFVYWRTGDYGIDVPTEDFYSGTDGGRVPWGSNKPLVHMAYPGDAPRILNKSASSTDGYIYFFNGVDDFWWDGVEIDDNGATRGIAVAISMNGRCVFRRASIHGTTLVQQGANVSLIFVTSGGGSYNVVQDCELYDSNGGYAVLGYQSPKTLVEDNNCYDVYYGPCAKSYNDRWTFRGNTVKGGSVGINGIWTQCYSGTAKPGNIEICFNYVEGFSENACRFNNEWNPQGGPHWAYRNTFKGITSVSNVYESETSGPYEFKNNLLLTSEGGDGIRQSASPLSAPDKLIVEGNVVEPLSSTVIDANGSLQGAARDAYLGVVGWEI